MSFVPGDVGQKSILTDGAQVDHLSENTVGYGVRVKGITNPATYPVMAGDVGEKITWSVAPTTITLTPSYTDFASISLKKGIWSIVANISVIYCTGWSVDDRGFSYATLTDSANVTVENEERSLYVVTRWAASNQVNVSLGFSAVVNVAADNTIYKIRGKKADITGTGIGELRHESVGYSSFFAIRIA